MGQPRSNRKRLSKLVSLIKGAKHLLIVMQDCPDPDAVAAAAGLRQIANSLEEIPCTLAHGGKVGRAENRALIKYLNINLRPMEEVEPDRFDVVAMVDTQPGTGNNSLGRDFVPDIVIDHHRIRRATRRCPFTDVRSRYGATSTILYEYLTEADIELDMPLATALLYGIRSDTQSLGREATKADIDAFLALYPLANQRMLSRIEHATVPREYFRLLAAALKNARVFGKGIFSDLGEVDNADMIPEVADLLLRNEDSTWALTLGIYEDDLLLSLRTSETGADAGRLMRHLVSRKGTGGGHRALAGGQVPITNKSANSIKKLIDTIQKRFAEHLDETKNKADPLV